MNGTTPDFASTVPMVSATPVEPEKPPRIVQRETSMKLALETKVELNFYNKILKKINSCKILKIKTKIIVVCIRKKPPEALEISLNPQACGRLT